MQFKKFPRTHRHVEFDMTLWLPMGDTKRICALAFCVNKRVTGHQEVSYGTVIELLLAGACP